MNKFIATSCLILTTSAAWAQSTDQFFRPQVSHDELFGPQRTLPQSSQRRGTANGTGTPFAGTSLGQSLGGSGSVAFGGSVAKRLNPNQQQAIFEEPDNPLSHDDLQYSPQ